jgi:hypothetical protein
MTLKNAAIKGYLVSSSETETTPDPEYDVLDPAQMADSEGSRPPSPAFLHAFLQLAKIVDDLHNKGLLLRSLRAAHVLLLEDKVRALHCSF